LHGGDKFSNEVYVGEGKKGIEYSKQTNKNDSYFKNFMGLL
jgi:hypothetical protein